METALLIASSLISGLVGVIVSTLYYRRYENRKWKLDTLKRLAAHRYAIAEGQPLERSAEFFVVLNEVFVVFHDAQEVLSVVEIIHKEADTPGRLGENMAKLLRACANRRVAYVTRVCGEAVQSLWALSSIKSCQPIGAASKLAF